MDSTNRELGRIMSVFEIDNEDVSNYLEVPLSVVDKWMPNDLDVKPTTMPQSELRRLIHILMQENLRSYYTK